MKNTHVLLIKFKNKISDDEVQFFRSSIIQKLGDQPDILYHNHVEKNKYRYSYPLIQYKNIEQQATIVCIDQGTKAIEKFFSQCDFNFQLGNRKVNMKFASVTPYKLLIERQSKMINYHIHNWLPLNSDNYKKYQNISILSERINFLEKILIGNILSFTKGVNYFIDFPLQCKLLQLSFAKLISNKNIKLMSFGADFQCNLNLPDYIGIGKHTSIGYGTITRN